MISCGFAPPGFISFQSFVNTEGIGGGGGLIDDGVIVSLFDEVEEIDALDEAVPERGLVEFREGGGGIGNVSTMNAAFVNVDWRNESIDEESGKADSSRGESSDRALWRSAVSLAMLG